MKDNLGVLLPLASLPSHHGIGDFGRNAKRFIRYLSNNGFKYWQVLP